MAEKKTENKARGPIKPKTKEMEFLLQAGYQLTVEQAKEIIAMREKDPASIPYEKMQEAKAFLAAYEGKAIPISTDKGWKRRPEAIPGA